MSAEQLQGFSMGGDPSGSTEPAPGSQAPPQQVQPSHEGQGQQQGQYSSPFLTQVPDNVRPLIEPYVRQWDAGVTQRFQQLQGQLQQYQQFGDAEDLATAAQLYDMLASNPMELLQLLHQGLDGRPEYQQWVAQTYGTPAASQAQWQQPGFPQVPGVPQGFAGQQQYVQPGSPVQGLPGQVPGQFPQQQQAPPEYIQKMGMLENIVGQLAQGFLEQRQAQEEAVEDQALDQYLEGLRQQYGDFDETYVLSMAQVGMPFEQAIQQYQQLAGARPLPQAPRPGPTLSGTGQAPQQAQTVKDLSNKDVQGLVAGVLAQVNQAGN
jgi:hypothetical protein